MVKKKDSSVTIPEIIWTDDLVWQLLAQIELSENRVMLLGKRKKGEVSELKLLYDTRYDVSVPEHSRW
jgi:hypothetical protein